MFSDVFVPCCAPFFLCEKQVDQMVPTATYGRGSSMKPWYFFDGHVADVRIEHPESPVQNNTRLEPVGGSILEAPQYSVDIALKQCEDLSGTQGQKTTQETLWS